MSKVPEHGSSDDDALYSINSDFDSDDIEEVSENDESEPSSEEVDDESNTAALEQGESWSCKTFKSNLPYYNGKLKLSNNFESKIPPNSSPTDFFVLYYTPELISYIVDQSNLYRIQTNKTQQVPMTETDLNCLIGFLFYSSVVPLPNKRDYWSCFSRQSIVADVINRDRILYLLSILHFHDNALEKHKIEKVEPILKYFNERSKLIVEPENNLSIDEQMIAWEI